ncbi:MAG: bifunctional oligoribonuclease/PAP phosphatase NrnA [Bacilli bacterium]
MYKQIYKQIKKYDSIVIARHIGPDPDALGAQLSLKDIIINKFPNKKVYAIGAPIARFKYLGKLDKIDDVNLKESLLIVLDTPDKDRIDGANPENYNYSIKIDHHPYIETFADIEIINDKASSTCELLIILCQKTKLELTKEIAEKIFVGIVADTNRFLFTYTSPKTFKNVAYLIEKFNLDIEELYQKLYFRPLYEVKLQGYIAENIEVTKNGLGYIKLNQQLMKEYNVDPATAGKMVNEFNNIDGIIVWMTLSEDSKQNTIRGSIRSRGPIINELAGKYNGGGHIYASGVRLKDWEEADKFIKDFDELCKDYNKKSHKE